jgi:hypothetical protein
MIWSFGDTPDTPCLGAPLLFVSATGCKLLTYDRVASCVVDLGWTNSPEFLFARILVNATTRMSKPTCGTFPLQQHSGGQDRQAVERRPKQRAKVAAIQGEQDFAPSERAKKNGPVLRGLENGRLVERQHIVHDDQVRPQTRPICRRLRREMWKIDEYLFKDIRRGDEEPTKIGRPTKDLTRSARRGPARGKQNAGVEKESHLASPSRNRFISASSCSIQALTCGAVKRRGGGRLPPWARSREAMNNSNCCFSSGGKASAAASISARVLMLEVYPFGQMWTSRSVDASGKPAARPALGAGLLTPPLRAW